MKTDYAKDELYQLLGPQRSYELGATMLSDEPYDVTGGLDRSTRHYRLMHESGFFDAPGAREWMQSLEPRPTSTPAAVVRSFSLTDGLAALGRAIRRAFSPSPIGQGIVAQEPAPPPRTTPYVATTDGQLTPAGRRQGLHL